MGIKLKLAKVDGVVCASLPSLVEWLRISQKKHAGCRACFEAICQDLELYNKRSKERFKKDD